MHVEIVLAALVMVVAVLVAADFFRRTSDAPHEYQAGNEQGPAHDAGTETYPASRAGSAALHSSSPSYEPAAAAPPAVARQDGARQDGARQDGARQDGARQDGARQASGAGTPAPSPDPGGLRTNWLVRTRLCLLAVVSAAAAALATASFIRAVGAFQRASADSNVSSMRDGALVSAILALLFAAVILAVGLCSALILIRSVVRPLRQLRTGAV